MKLSATALLAAVLLCASPNVPIASAQIVAAGAKKPCLESGGVAINLNGNFGFCYLKGRRMRHGSVFAQCQDGALSCYADEGIPDKPRQKVDCIAPEPGFCGSSKDATPAPTPSASAAAHANATASSSGSGDDSEAGDADDEVAEPSTEVREANDEPTVNPSALVAGNLSNGETYEDEDADADDDTVLR